MEVLVHIAALNFAVPVACWFLVFPISTPMSGSALCSLSWVFLDVSGHTVHFSRVAVGNLHPAHQRSKAPVSPWPVRHFWFWHFIQHGPFDRWEARLLCSADLPFQVVWVAKKGVLIYSGKTHTPFLAKGIIVEVLPLFLCFKGDSNLPPEICFLQFCLAFKYFSLPPLSIFLDESYHL